MTNHTIAIVTGANKGIGLAIVRNLALQFPKSSFNKGPLLIYLTARNAQRGEDAVVQLQSDEQLTAAKALQQHGGLTSLKYKSLDITESKSIHDFGEFLKHEHPDGVDIVVNNAGIALDGFNLDVVAKTLQCNYYGTLEACETFLPLIKPHGRLVNVASIAGTLNRYSAPLKQAFQTATATAEYTQLMKDFRDAVSAGTHIEKGWPSSAYMPSKAGMIGITRVFARQEQERGGQRLINSVCPGYVDTDMSKHRGHKTVDDGAATPVLLAIGDIGGVSGEFWQEGEVIEWDKSLVEAMLSSRRRRKSG